jgi:hypothetical protein
MIQYRAMQYYNWNRLEEEPLNPLLGRKMIHGQKCDGRPHPVAEGRCGSRA